MYEATISHFAEVARDKAAGLSQAPFGFFVGSMLGGAYIGIAMILALSCAAGFAPDIRPIIMGSTFGIGLILTVFAGAELFTGYVMYAAFGLARRSVTVSESVGLLVTVWIGNLAGALVLCALFIAGGGGAVMTDGGAFLNGYVVHKVNASALALVSRAILCNWLVCLAIWTAARMSSDAGKCIALAWVLLAFVAAGFEHSVANMTALALGLLDPHPAIALGGALRNLTLVTIGNVVGGTVLVVGGYLATAKIETRSPAPFDQMPLSNNRKRPALRS